MADTLERYLGQQVLIRLVGTEVARVRLGGVYDWGVQVYTDEGPLFIPWPRIKAIILEEADR